MKETYLAKILCQPWHMSRERMRLIVGSMMVHLRQDRLRQERPTETMMFGSPLPVMQIVGDIAIIPIVGTLLFSIPDWLKSWDFFSGTDVNDIEEEITKAINDPTVRAIVLDIDSPGGLSTAGGKLFDLVEQARQRKPILAWCADGADMCSAAYNCAASASAIFAGRYSTVGSIGSYLALLDDSDFWNNLGITWEVFRSGQFKGLGIDPLTDPQREYLQSLADQSGAEIRANVSKYRGSVTADDMQGQWFQGGDAARRGFVTALAPNRTAAIARFRQLAA